MKQHQDGKPPKRTTYIRIGVFCLLFLLLFTEVSASDLKPIAVELDRMNETKTEIFSFQEDGTHSHYEEIDLTVRHFKPVDLVLELSEKEMAYDNTVVRITHLQKDQLIYAGTLSSLKDQEMIVRLGRNEQKISLRIEIDHINTDQKVTESNDILKLSMFYQSITPTQAEEKKVAWTSLGYFFLFLLIGLLLYLLFREIRKCVQSCTDYDPKNF